MPPQPSRAKERLAKPRSNSLLKACWPAVEQRFEALAGEPREVEELSMAGLLYEEAEENTLAIAASGEVVAADAAVRPMPMLQRLPLNFDPLARFREAEQHRLAYPVASALRSSAVFERPEGSFAVRAFGNVVHRYLQLLAMKLQAGVDPEDLLRSCRRGSRDWRRACAERGLRRRLAAREAARAAEALGVWRLRDPVGRWILSPHASAASERALAMASVEDATLAGRSNISRWRCSSDRWRGVHLDRGLQDERAGFAFGCGV